MRKIPQPTGAVATVLAANGELERPFGGHAVFAVPELEIAPLSRPRIPPPDSEAEERERARLEREAAPAGVEPAESLEALVRDELRGPVAELVRQFIPELSARSRMAPPLARQNGRPGRRRGSGRDGTPKRSVCSAPGRAQKGRKRRRAHAAGRRSRRGRSTRTARPPLPPRTANARRDEAVLPARRPRTPTAWG
jgi:hypothetical protein